MPLFFILHGWYLLDRPRIHRSGVTKLYGTYLFYLGDHQTLFQNDWARGATKLEHSSTETIWMIWRPQLWAPGDWQLHHDNVPAHASHLVQRFLVKQQIIQVTQPPYSPDLAPCDFWLFPKLKSLLKGKRFQTISEIQEYTTGQLMVIGRPVWSPKVPILKGSEVSLSYVQCFLYLLQ